MVQSCIMHRIPLHYTRLGMLGSSILLLLILWLANHCNAAFLPFFRSKQKFLRFFVFWGRRCRDEFTFQESPQVTAD